MGVNLTSVEGVAFKKCFLIITIGSILNSCGPIGSRGGSRRANGYTSNLPSTLNDHHGRILERNPIVVSGDLDYSVTDGFEGVLDASGDFITENGTLYESCKDDTSTYSVDPCWEVYHDRSTSIIEENESTWGFAVDSNKFWQVHLFGHIRRAIKRYLNFLDFSYDEANPSGTSGGGTYFNAIPPDLYTQSAFWYDQELDSYVNCEEGTAIAFFDPFNFETCYGYDPDITGFNPVQDPSIIYHEMGHVFMKVMINYRNIADGDIDDRVDLGYSTYDEGGALNEGIADYFSFLMTHRKFIFEWGGIRYYNFSRPIYEEDPIHVAGVWTNEDSRVSYPDFLTYDAFNPTIPLEDIHQAGQVISHYLIALTEDLEDQCSLSTKNASKYIFYAMAEAVAEMGDLTSLGSDQSSEDRVNLTETNNNSESVSKLWSEVVTPPNYRRFIQFFAKYLYYITNDSYLGLCDNYSQDDIEDLLDQYGLLLFKTYNLNGSNATNGHSGTNLSVDNSNIARTILVSKDAVDWPPDQNATRIFVFDDQTQIDNIISASSEIGRVDSTELSDLIPSDYSYNNGNGKISPGEIVGLAFNLYNESNATIGGVQILGNDWDHGKMESGYLTPCNTFYDTDDEEFPQDGQGAATAETGTAVAGDCGYTTRTNGGDTSTSGEEILMPVCMMQYSDDEETLWVSQDYFLANDDDMTTDNCLGGDDATSDCYMRVIPGLETAFYSKIDPVSTWNETLTDSGGSTPVFSVSNLIFFEINPWTPPGTTFACRFRARFTNCMDCWHDEDNDYDDWLDYEYSGADPFELIHWEFTVID